MGHLTAIVLGAAAGGGFPQWNCRCPVCQLAWAGDTRVKPRTQASLAVSADGEAWTILNAAPDLRAQVQATPALQPRSGARHSPIAAVVLTGAEVDQIAGLLTLRERQDLYRAGHCRNPCGARRQSDFRCARRRRRDAQGRQPRHAVPAARRADRGALRRSRQGRPLPRRRRSGARQRNRRQCRRRARLRRAAARLRAGRRRDDGCLCGSASPAPTWCCSTARCSSTTK